MNFFKKKLDNKSAGGRRNFMMKSVGSILGAGLLVNTASAFSNVKSKTGLIYVKRNGEIINDYIPQDAAIPYLGSIMMVGFSFAPIGWLLCNGQLLPILTNDALFTLIGTTYGGDGISTFGLPNLQSRLPIGQGQGLGLSSYILGQMSGTEEVTLTANQIPAHNHSINASTASGTAGTPSNNFIAQNADGIDSFSGSSNGLLNTGEMGATGGNQAHSNIQPYLSIYFCIATEGIFPLQS